MRDLRCSGRLEVMLWLWSVGAAWPRRIWCFALVATLSLVVSPGVGWAEASSERVQRLRQAGEAAFQAGRYREAKKAFDEAFHLSKLHSVGLWAARSRAELGELIEARTHLNRLTRMPLAPQAPDTEKEAREKALRLWNELSERIPRLRLSVVGVEPTEVRVTINGKVIHSSFLQRNAKGPFRRGKMIELNPGKHHVVGVYSSDLQRDLWVTLEPGQRREVRLTFPNPGTLRQRKCRDQCREDCAGDNACYVDCKRKCFTKKRKRKKRGR